METKTIFISIQMTEINELKNLKDILEGLMDNVLQVWCNSASGVDV
jgi:hypothetical protein